MRKSAIIFCIIVCTCFFILPASAQAQQSLIINAQNGQPLFYFDIFDQGSVFGSQKYENPTETSTWTLQQQQIDSITYAGEYWSHLLGNLPKNTSPINITVGTYNDQNADAISQVTSADFTELANGILNNVQPEGGAAQIRIGSFTGNFEDGYYGPLTVLPRNGEYWHLGSVLLHEVGHAMGILASRNEVFLPDDAYFSNDPVSAWTTHLVDSFGNKAQPGMKIVLNTSPTPNAFTVNYFGSSPFYREDFGFIFFQGAETLAVLEQTVDNTGKLLTGTLLGGSRNSEGIGGVPINSIEFDPDNRLFFTEFSHIELTNSMMSHQNYRNYTGFMEAELAMLQDIGINVDRKNFFGNSIYVDGQNREITQGYYARNAEGTAYLPGEYNSALMGVGVHLYGSNNTVLVNADMLSEGFGGAGIRIDGVGNEVTIASGRRVHSNGDYGTGLMVSYGSDHRLVHRGDVQALGEGGVAARFDFGSNLLGNYSEYRGSWMQTNRNSTRPLSHLNPELQGSLVSNFDVTGALSGREAAIYISENALVDNINFMRGTALTGDIISDWNPMDDRIVYAGPDSLHTALTFGYMPDVNGKKISALDSDFTLEYRGNIRGRNSFDVDLAAGELTYGGQMDVYSYRQQSASTLRVMANYSGDEVTAISALENINLEANSIIGVSNDNAFSYGSTLPETFSVLKLDAEGAVNNQASVADSSGSFSRGFYDYQYYNPRWRDSQNLVVDSKKKYNDELAATMAVSAPLAIAAQGNITSSVASRMTKFFSRYYQPGCAINTDGATEQDELSCYGLDSFRTGQGGFWLTPTYTRTRNDRFSRYTINTPGMGAGIDVAANHNLFLGLGIDWSRPEFESNDADVDAEKIAGTLYGGAWLPGNVELGLTATFGKVDYEQKRNAKGERYSANYDSTNYGAGVSLGRNFHFDTFSLRPFINYEYQKMEVDNFQENAGTYALTYEKAKYNMHRLRPGVEVSHTFAAGTFIKGQAYYSGLFGDRQADVPVYYSNDRGRNINLSRGVPLDRHMGGLGMQAGVRFRENMELSGDANYLKGANTDEYSFGISFTALF